MRTPRPRSLGRTRCLRAVAAWGFATTPSPYDDMDDGYEEDSHFQDWDLAPSSGSPLRIFSKLPPGSCPMVCLRSSTSNLQPQRRRTRRRRRRSWKAKELSGRRKNVRHDESILTPEVRSCNQDRRAGLAEDLNLFVDYTGGYEDGEAWRTSPAGSCR